MKKAALACALAIALTACQTVSIPVAQEAAAIEAPTSLLLEKGGVSVVEVIATMRYREEKELPVRWMDQFFQRTRPSVGAREIPTLQKLGAGIVIRRDGVILTNAHVVRGADEVNVRLSNQEFHLARVIGVDRATDVALVKIDAGELEPATFGHSKRLQRGEWVAALGSPDGFPSTVTTGIVSAKARTLDSSAIPLIQTDMAAHRNNAGGPLINSNGEVVGLSSDLYGRGTNGNSSFAIPIEIALDVARQLQANGKVRHRHFEMRL